MEKIYVQTVSGVESKYYQYGRDILKESVLNQLSSLPADEHSIAIVDALDVFGALKTYSESLQSTSTEFLFEEFDQNERLCLLCTLPFTPDISYNGIDIIQQKIQKYKLKTMNSVVDFFLLIPPDSEFNWGVFHFKYDPHELNLKAFFYSIDHSPQEYGQKYTFGSDILSSFFSVHHDLISFIYREIGIMVTDIFQEEFTLKSLKNGILLPDDAPLKFYSGALVPFNIARILDGSLDFVSQDLNKALVFIILSKEYRQKKFLSNTSLLKSIDSTNNESEFDDMTAHRNRVQMNTVFSPYFCEVFSHLLESLAITELLFQTFLTNAKNETVSSGNFQGRINFALEHPDFKSNFSNIRNFYEKYHMNSEIIEKVLIDFEKITSLSKIKFSSIIYSKGQYFFTNAQFNHIVKSVSFKNRFKLSFSHLFLSSILNTDDISQVTPSFLVKSLILVIRDLFISSKFISEKGITGILGTTSNRDILGLLELGVALNLSHILNYFQKISFDRRYQIKVATDNSKVLFPVGTKYLAQSNRAIFSPYEYITLIRLSIDNVSPDNVTERKKRSLAATLNYLTSSYEFYQGLFSIFNSFADEKCTNENFNRHISIYNSNKNQTVKDTDEVASSSQSTMLSSPYTEGFFEQNALGLLPSTLPNALPSLANNLHVESSYPGTLHFLDENGIKQPEFDSSPILPAFPSLGAADPCLAPVDKPEFSQFPTQSFPQFENPFEWDPTAAQVSQTIVNQPTLTTTFESLENMPNFFEIETQSTGQSQLPLQLEKRKRESWGNGMTPNISKTARVANQTEVTTEEIQVDNSNLISDIDQYTSILNSFFLNDNVGAELGHYNQGLIPPLEGLLDNLPIENSNNSQLDFGSQE
ncbi:uncharacterized protein SAPINGB_P006067 [Magnusiomyces paraingens]|uniref:Uncharacterized protein n=1 Tax=Magnusiomyces paraingens TaxID=2606893 RepID=A0A5E8C536_9ASCO|nr:uncharacterized protein SAPINGB_P006067 [Saprochaete ingens]VVT58160.1 unnamed protein product [Saprochaete ingens]